jgi:uncharacterized protein YndB with AHSA1/START domain
VAIDYPGLRYADGPCVEAEIVIAATPEAVFALVSDIDLPARFSTEFKGARWLDGASAPRAGARFAGRNVHAAVGEWETVCTVVEYDPPRAFAYCVEGMDGGVGSTWRFSVTPEGDGCRLRQWMQMGPGRSFINVAIEAMPEKESRILNRRVHEHRVNMEANVAGVKELVER